MIKTLIALSPEDADARVREGRALLLDIRDRDEFVRRHIPGALSRPLASLAATQVGQASHVDVIFTCRSGMRTSTNAGQLAATVAGPAYMLAGGVDAWEKAALPVETNRKAPLEMMRQVQIAAGALVMLGVALGFLVSPRFFGLSAFVGAGLTFAGISGFCGMAKLLAFLPWNGRATA